MVAEKARPYLRRGASAEELARELGVSLEQVQLLLYKLRLAGLVAPAHAFEDGGREVLPPGRFEAA